MKKILQILCLCLVSYVARAQEQSQHQLFVGNSAVDYASGNLRLQMQIGNPILSSSFLGNIKTTTGFPYGVLYASPTFIIDEFEVSKGYFGDKINIKWALGANIEKIQKINIYRREFAGTTPYQLVGSVSADVFEFNDTQIEGGVLYQYKVEAYGVSNFDKRYLTFMDGIGFRNPTATVSGSVSFDGGSPVQDVLVYAEASGAENSSGSSLKTTSDGYVAINNIAYDIFAKKLTLQAWISSNTNGSIIKFTTKSGKVVDLRAGKLTDNVIVIYRVVDNQTIDSISLSNSYPTGALDVAGNDVFKNISTLTDTSFFHVSAVFEDGITPKYFINGRELTQDYITNATVAENVLSPSLEVTQVKDYPILNEAKISKVILVDGFTGIIDEVRVWQRTLTNKEIRRDYRRYLSGGETSLSIYLRMDEASGENLYDFSKKGFRQNKNNGIFVKLTDNSVEFSRTKPSSEQLGVFGVTDENGSYTVSSISYFGTGESFVITPSLGVHAFKPASQTLFLGSEESVVNQLNFTDISSFKFNGRAVYNVQNVFNTIPLDLSENNYTQIEDYGYNKYRVTSNGAKIIINKGQFYYEGGAINSDNGFYEEGALKKYPVIGLEKAYVYIDGNIVINSENQPVETDAEGNFTVYVPIGKHKIEVKKDGHTFEYMGNFPSTSTFDFFEDQLSSRWFIDTTRISLIGRVVGGKKESDKPIGFGLDGAFSYTNYAGEVSEESEIISSINNIGAATITLKGDIDTSTFDVIVPTNSNTGEYEASLIPYIYYIKAADLKIPTNTDISILSSTETLNLLATPVLDSVSYTTKDGTELFSAAFHHKKSFKYNSPVTLALIDQEYENNITIGENTYDISGLDKPIYIQTSKYNITFEVSQNYVNKDVSGAFITTKEYFTEGILDITNNLEIADKSTTVVSNNGEEYKYSFYAGEANTTITDDFAKGMSVQYIIDGSNPLSISNIVDFKSDGIIKGGASAGGVAFATYAPETPDIILRDPPGSNSFAFIERGTTITYSEEKTSTSVNEDGGGFYFSVGPTWELSTGFGVLVGLETSIVRDLEGTFNKSIENTAQNVTTNSYTFNQTISTSDDPNFVGADGDLYIGNSRNMYYGIFDNIFITSAPLKKTDGTVIAHIIVKAKTKDENGIESEKDLFITAREQSITIDQPTKTFFTYSQKYLVEVLIPEFTTLANDFVFDPDKPLMTAESYREQADLWRKIIQENERSKYEAKNNKDAYKQAVLAKIQGFGNFQDEMTALVSDNFFSNQSFDAGVGEFTSAISSAKIIGNSVELNIETSAEYKEQLGVLINNVGLVGNLTQTDTTVDTENYNSESEITNTISYTLKDNDQNNVLSVDVLNMFDGNGPIFVTKAGSTSCPYEPETTSLFYKKTGYDKDLIGEGGEILSAPTNRVYLPQVTTVKDKLVNIPESEGALFSLLLKNNSETNSDLEYIIEVDALTLNGATTNIAANGVNIYLPFNETVEFPFEVYKSSASSIFKYDNIRVYLKAPCDDINVSDGFIDVSVEFKPSCSKVTVSVPENNFIFNRAEGYSKDAYGNTTTNTLPITFTDFNIDFNGFKKIELQYRNASSANWIKLASYYGSGDLKSTAGDSNGIVIGSSDAEFTYKWDIIGDKITDGNYQFRAISYCTDNITYNSAIISGIVNLNSPVLFGTPQPSDGILDVGEDILARFNEAIFKREATNIKVTGLSNQQQIDHAVSVYLDGTANKIELPNQRLGKDSFTLQFWYKNQTAGSGKLISQENGINATLNGNELTFSVGESSVKATINPAQYNFYSLVYQSGNDPQLLILENGNKLQNKTLSGNLDINSNSSIFIGGNAVIGNIHDIRLWSKPFTPSQATLAKDVTLTGKELNLLGYWKLDEGTGNIALDKAKSKNATVGLGWDIKPKGTGYEFKNSEFLTLDNVGFIQPSNFEDITLSFWIKPNQTSTGTIFSNGRGNDSEMLLTNGFRNKWSVNLKADGNLELLSENISYPITFSSLAKDSWAHVAIVRKVGGSLNSYINGKEELSVSSAKTGGFTGNKILVGAQLYKDLVGNETIENHFTGLLDEIRFWNTARSLEQIKRDRYFEIDSNSEGLLLKLDFNQDATNTSNGPSYNHVAVNLTNTSTYAKLKAGAAQRYTQDSPPLKPMLQFTNIPFSAVINGDEMIIQPDLTDEDWSLFEGQILNFSVSRMYDEHFNEQLSPINWSGLVNKQEIEWFTENQTKEINDEKIIGEAYSFIMDVVNKGGSNQPFAITGLPTWLKAEVVSGSVAPNAKKQIKFTVDNDLAMGNYTSDIFLETASGFNDRLTFTLRVLSEAPDWSVNATEYSYSMNLIGKIKINGSFSRDIYTKVGAFVNDKPRGEAYLKYDVAYNSYYVFLTAYSNLEDANGNFFPDEITFKIWDAINGKTVASTIDNLAKISFEVNGILGSKSAPKIFATTNLVEQNLQLNNGWTWVSLFADDAKFNNLNQTFSSLDLQFGDAIKSQSQYANFESGSWNGDLLELVTSKMYKLKLSKPASIRFLGEEISPSNFTINIKKNWNWLPFPIHRDMPLNEALAFFDVSEGDVIKDQFNFAIYDTYSGWSGTLNYLESGTGYMLKSSVAQTFKYPDADILFKTVSTKKAQKQQVDNANDFAQYSGNMNIIAEVISDENFTKVLIYDEKNVVRGSSEIVDINNKRISFITAFSNLDETLKFVLANDFQAVDIHENFVFVNNLVLGDLKNPVQLSTKALTLENLILTDAILYPNPFTNEITIDVSKENIEISKVEVFNIIGISLLSKTNNLDQKITINTSNLSNGIYLIRLTDTKGEIVVKKMIKE
jgi:hypothetical protein